MSWHSVAERMSCEARHGEFDGGPDNGHGITGLEKSSDGGM